MKQRIFKSFSVRLSLRFMFILTGAVLLLSITFLMFIRSLVHKNQEAELKNAECAVFRIMETYRRTIDPPLKFGAAFDTDPQIPYYITYIV